jgi:hypothetical protein
MQGNLVLQVSWKSHLRRDRFTRRSFTGLPFLRKEQGYWEYRVATFKTCQARKSIVWLEILRVPCRVLSKGATECKVCESIHSSASSPAKGIIEIELLTDWEVSAFRSKITNEATGAFLRLRFLLDVFLFHQSEHEECEPWPVERIAKKTKL